MYNILNESILFQKCYRLMRNNHIHECMIYIERIKILHSKLPLRYQRHKTTNSQKLQQKSKLHTTTHNFHTTHFHYKSNTTKRFVWSSSKKWLPRISFIDPNSRWYCICREPSLSSPFLPLIFVCRGFVHWRRGVGTYQKCEICIRFVLSSSTKLPPRISFIDPNSWWYCICREPSLSSPFLPLISVCRGFVHWRRGVGTYQKCEICIRFVLSSSTKWPPRISFIDPNSRWYCICREPSLSSPFRLYYQICFHLHLRRIFLLRLLAHIVQGVQWLLNNGRRVRAIVSGHSQSRKPRCLNFKILPDHRQLCHHHPMHLEVHFKILPDHLVCQLCPLDHLLQQMPTYHLDRRLRPLDHHHPMQQTWLQLPSIMKSSAKWVMKKWVLGEWLLFGVFSGVSYRKLSWKVVGLNMFVICYLFCGWCFGGLFTGCCFILTK